jgi:hypothetical protein
MFLAVYLEGFLPVCKVTSQVESPAVCLVVWEVGCLEDQVDPVPNNFHQTQVQGLAQCKGFLINRIPLTQVILHFNHLDHKAYLRRLEWGIQVQRQRSPCWLSRTDRWKPSKGGTLKRENREREVA